MVDPNFPPLIIREHSVWGYTVFSLILCGDTRFFPLYKGYSNCVLHSPGSFFLFNNKGKVCVEGTQFFP